MTDIIYKDESYAILGACFNVYNDKGCGFLEPVYQECCGTEFTYQHIPHLAQMPLQLTYRGQILKQCYKPDFVCYGKLILEIKAVSQLTDEHRAGYETWDTAQFWSSAHVGIRTNCFIAFP
jgi:GxxExxY protein